MEAVCKRMQAGLIQLKQQAAPPDNTVPQSPAAAIKQDITAAAENIKREVIKLKPLSSQLSNKVIRIQSHSH